jgi:hypothetical protein
MLILLLWNMQSNMYPGSHEFISLVKYHECPLCTLENKALNIVLLEVSYCYFICFFCKEYIRMKSSLLLRPY